MAAVRVEDMEPPSGSLCAVVPKRSSNSSYDRPDSDAAETQSKKALSHLRQKLKPYNRDV